MNSKISIFLHIAGWSILLCSPLMYIDWSAGFDIARYLFFSVNTFTLMVAFYVNYLSLVPRYYIPGDHTRFYIINVIMVMALAVFLHVWINYGHGMFQEPKHHRPHIADFVRNNLMLIFTVRDIFNITVAAAMATIIRLAENWHKSELALQEAEKERTKAELKNLRSQIKPHFMLNTLNNIYALTSFSPEKAREAIEQLSGLLRHILYENEKQEISIHDEVRFISDYISLMRLRVPGNVDVRYVTNIHEDCHATIAPMILISLVENAFKHGISPTNPSFIHINITADNDTVECTIRNSSYPKCADDKSGHGIGLVQVAKRLELSYANRYSWTKKLSDDGKTYTSKIIIYNNN